MLETLMQAISLQPFYMYLPLLHFFVGEEKSSIIFYLYALYFMGLYNLHIPVYCLSRGSGMVMVFPLGKPPMRSL